jgi:phosphoenolpyruvate phosphomutase
MPHFKEADPSQLFEFAERYRARGLSAPLVAVPSAYPHVSESELGEHGFQIVIYANQLLRAAYPAMRETAEAILRHGRGQEAESLCMPIQDVLTLVPGGS